MLLGLTSSVGSQEEGVGAGGGLHHELVKSQALATSLCDSGAGGLGEAEGSNVDLGHIEESLVVGDGGNADNGTVSLSSEMLDELGEGERGAVGP